MIKTILALIALLIVVRLISYGVFEQKENKKGAIAIYTLSAMCLAISAIFLVVFY